GELTPAFRQHRLQMLRVLTVEVPDSIQRISILDVEVWGRAETELPRIQACRQPDERRVVDLDLPVVGLTLYLEICLDLVELRHQLLERAVRLQVGILRGKLHHLVERTGRRGTRPTDNDVVAA